MLTVVKSFVSDESLESVTSVEDVVVKSFATKLDYYGKEKKGNQKKYNLKSPNFKLFESRRRRF
jgi:hypothetical protein